MRFTAALLALAGLVAAVPTADTDGNLPFVARDAEPMADIEARGAAPDGVTLVDVKYGGSGCPQGSVSKMFSDDKTTLTMIYDQFIAQSGPGIKPIDYRKNCQLNVKMHFPQGWQFGILSLDTRGYASIPGKKGKKGATGFCKNTYYFSGSTQQVSTNLLFDTPYENNYIKSDRLGVESTVWSRCGTEGMLNINSQIGIQPLGTNDPALLTVDSQDLKYEQKYHFQWRRC